MRRYQEAGDVAVLSRLNGEGARLDDALAETIRSYDRTAAHYAVRYSDSPLHKYLDRFTSRLLTTAGDYRVLDAGCGHGRDCAALEARQIPVFGLDLSKGLLGEANRITDAPLIQGDMRRMPFQSGSFAGLWACASLVHLGPDDLDSALTEFARVVRPGGALFVSVRDGSGEEWRTDPEGARRKFHLYDVAYLRSALNRAGFVIDDIAREAGVVAGQWVNAFASRA